MGGSHVIVTSSTECWPAVNVHYCRYMAPSKSCTSASLPSNHPVKSLLSHQVVEELLLLSVLWDKYIKPFYLWGKRPNYDRQAVHITVNNVHLNKVWDYYFKSFNFGVETLNPKYGSTTCWLLLSRITHVNVQNFLMVRLIQLVESRGWRSLSPSLSKSHVKTYRRITPLRTSAYKADKECKCVV